MSTKRCSSCNGELGFMYLLTRGGYRCMPCHIATKTINKLKISKMVDVEDIPPIDGKYRQGIIAGSETMAKSLADQYYESTPSMDDWEN